jgi:hypothetical protein
MDPIEYAAAYDNKFRSALGQRFNTLKINADVIRKCLRMNNS